MKLRLARSVWRDNLRQTRRHFDGVRFLRFFWIAEGLTLNDNNSEKYTNQIRFTLLSWDRERKKERNCVVCKTFIKHCTVVTGVSKMGHNRTKKPSIFGKNVTQKWEFGQKLELNVYILPQNGPKMGQICQNWSNNHPKVNFWQFKANF